MTDRTDNRDPFAIGGWNGETSTETTGNSASCPVSEVVNAARDQTPPRRSEMPYDVASMPVEQLAVDGQSIDPLIALGAEVDRLDHIFETASDELSDAAAEDVLEVQDQIADLVPTSIAGALIQLKVLRQRTGVLEPTEESVFADKILDNLTAGLFQLQSTPLPSAQIGIKDNDAEILALFRQWLDEWRTEPEVSDNEELYDALVGRTCALEHEIADTPAQGAIGMAIKAYMAAYYRNDCRRDNPAGLSLITSNTYVRPDEDPDDFVSMHAFVAVMRDAARFVPEIVDLAAPVINPSREARQAEWDRFNAWVANHRERIPYWVPKHGRIIEAVVELPDGTRGVYRAQ